MTYEQYRCKIGFINNNLYQLYYLCAIERVYREKILQYHRLPNGSVYWHNLQGEVVHFDKYHTFIEEDNQSSLQMEVL